MDEAKGNDCKVPSKVGEFRGLELHHDGPGAHDGPFKLC